MEHEYKDDQQMFKEDYADFVNNEFKKRQNERSPFELTWRLNAEFIKGNQFLSINAGMKKIEEVPKLYWWQEREVFNQLSTIVETRIARLSRQQPIMKARPASSDEGDYQSSKIASGLLQAKWYDDKMANKYSDLVAWVEHTGTGFIKNTWNPKKGKKIGTFPIQKMIEDEGFQIPTTEEIEIFEGEVESTVISPFEIYPDSSNRNGLEECKSIIHAKAFHVDDIKDEYGIDVEPEQIDSYGIKSSSGISGATYNAGGYRHHANRIKDHAIVKEYYERPSNKHKNGRLIIVAGDETLHVGELPYKIGDDSKRDFPFVRVPCIHIPNTFWGQSIAERCIPIQRRYNALRNRKAEYLNLVAIGQWYSPNGAVDEETELNNAPANIIHYEAGIGKPEPVGYPSLPASFENEEQTLLAEFTAISGVSELSRYSEAPSGVKSGVALSIANEQDDTRISMTANRLSDGIRDTGVMWLRLYKQFVQEPRIVRTVGKDVDIMEWSASDLQSDDVIIENSSALAETPAQRRQMVFDLMNTGLFNRPENNPFGREAVNKILELIELGHWETGVDDIYTLHENKAQRENRMLENGKVPQIQPYDDHAIHIQEHDKFRLRPEYEEMLMTPMGQQIAYLLEQHVQMHRNVLQQQQLQQQMAMQQQMPQPQ